MDAAATPPPLPFHAEPPRRTLLLAAGLVVGVTWLAYANSFSGALVYDDRVALTENLSIRQLWPPGPAFSAPPGSGTGGRPLANFSFALSYALSGLQPWGHHLINLIIHSCAALALFSVARRTLRQPALAARFGAASLPLATALALLWAVHPLGTQTVTYLSQRTESLMALCALLTLYCFIRGAADGPRRWFPLAVLACALGALCKETIATAPLLVLLYDRTFLAGTFAAALRTRGRLYLALASSWLLLAYLLSGVAERGVGYGLGISWLHYALTQSQAILLYLSLSFWPYPLIFDRGPDLLTSFSAAAPHLLGLVLLLAAVIWALRRRPVLGFAGAWFLLVLAPTSSVIPIIQQPIAENRPYLPSVAVVAGVVLLLYRFTPPRLALALCAILTGCAALATALRNRTYTSALALWADTAAKAPANPRAHYDLGLALEQAGRLPEALFEYRWALHLQPTHAKARHNLANHLALRRAFAAAIAEYEIVLRLDDSVPYAHLNLGVVLTESDAAARALPHLARALRDHPDSPVAHATLGQALLALDRAADALPHLVRAAQLQPQRAATHNFHGLALVQLGRRSEALASFQRAAAADPSFAEAFNNLGDSLLQLGRAPEAVAALQRALALQPDLADAHQNLGDAYARLDRLPDAVAHYATVVRLRPDRARAHNNLGALLFRLGRTGEAVAALQTAVRLDPTDPEARANLAWVQNQAPPPAAPVR